VESEQRSGLSEFGTLLRRHRLAAGLSQDALAERARMSSAAISALERGQRRCPQRDTLALLAGALALDAAQRSEFEAAGSRPRSVRRGNASVTVGPWRDTAESPLPLALARFVGRATELDEIRTLVREYRLVTLTGSGGIGKTQTALQTASAMHDAEGATVHFVELAPLTGPALVSGAIAAAFGVQEVPNHPLLDTLIAHLKNKALLLLLDNCEHVIDEVASAAYKLLLNCPNLRILATSREALRTAGERAYRLPSLSLAEAVELFTDRACAADYHFTLSDENRAVVVDLCRRLDGIPLAIEMAAARVQTHTPREILTMLEGQFGLLSAGDRAVPKRQQTMRATLDWSYQLLTIRERALFERLSVFANGCTLEMAVAVCGGEGQEQAEIRELLASLTNKSLVITDFEGLGPRYRLFESARQYGQEKLEERAERDAIAHRHALAYLKLAEELRDAYDSAPDRDWFETCRAELDNWLRALDFSLARRHDVIAGQRLAGALSFVWPAFAPTEGRRWLTLALSLVNEGTPLHVRAGISCAEMRIVHNFNDVEQELAIGNKALSLCQELGDEFWIATALTHQGNALLHLERLPEGESALSEALAISRRLGCKRLLSWTLRTSAYACVKRTDFAKARAHLVEARAVADFGADREMALALCSLAFCEDTAGNAELAAHYAAEALPVLRASYSPLTLSVMLSNLAGSLITSGQYSRAEDHAREALTIAREMHSKVHAAHALLNLALIKAFGAHGEPARLRKARTDAAQICGFLEAQWLADSSLWVGDTFHQECQQDCRRARTQLCDVLGKDIAAKLATEGAMLTEEQVCELASATTSD
jgi:predicted ATPase/DNA-binding XRE family transcriptional regulator